MEADKNYVQVLSVTDLEGTEKVAKPYEGLPGSYWYIPQISIGSAMTLMYPDSYLWRLVTSEVRNYTYDPHNQVYVVQTENSIYTLKDAFSSEARRRAKATLYMTAPIGRRYREDNPDPERHLLAYGKYRTKIFPCDLPEWYVGGYMYKRHGYISAKGVKHLHYKPNYLFNHLYKDDILLVSYGSPITPVKSEDGFEWFEGYDHILSGIVIVDFVKAAAKYSGIETSGIEEELRKKKEWYEAKYK